MRNQSVDSDTWLQTSDGDLVRADMIAELHCKDGQATARLTSGLKVLLAGPGCPENFHQLLLATLALAKLTEGSNSIVIVRAQTDVDKSSWVWTIDSASCAELDPIGTGGYGR